MSKTHIQLQIRGEHKEIAVIRLTRGAKRNALNDALILALREIVGGAVTGRRRGDSQENREEEMDQAAPRTCSSMTMSPRPTACTNASITFGSKRVPAKLLILSTT